MKSLSLFKIYRFILLVIFAGIVLHAPLSVGLGSLFPSADLLIKSWKEILMAIAGLLAIRIVWNRNAWKDILEDRIVQIVVIYIALHLLIASAVLTGAAATIAGLAIDLRYVVFFILVYVCIKLAPEYRERFVKIAAAGAVIVVGFGVLQLFLPPDILSYIGYGENTIQPYMMVDDNPDFIRINSTLRGPNPLGAYIVIVVGLIAALFVRRQVPRSNRRPFIGMGVMAFCSAVVLWVTYSRSAAVAAGLTVFLTVAVAGKHLISRRLLVVACVVLLAVIGGIFIGRDHPLVENVVLHEKDKGASLTTSNDDHVESLFDGTERMLRQPIGAGVGSTGSASLMSDDPLIIENQYLFIAHEVGWLGLGLFITLFTLIIRRLWQLRRDWLSLAVFTSGIGLAFIGILLPVWADDTVSIIWWGLAALAIASGGQYVRRTTKQKAKRSL